MTLALFRYAAGRERRMNLRYALLLARLHRGEIVDQSAAPVQPTREAMTVDELRLEAEALGLKVHHRSGRDKLIAALEAADGAD